MWKHPGHKVHLRARWSSRDVIVIQYHRIALQMEPNNKGLSHLVSILPLVYKVDDVHQLWKETHLYSKTVGFPANNCKTFSIVFKHENI